MENDYLIFQNGHDHDYRDFNKGIDHSITCVPIYCLIKNDLNNNKNIIILTISKKDKIINSYNIIKLK